MEYIGYHTLASFLANAHKLRLPVGIMETKQRKGEDINLSKKKILFYWN